jgi:hypothetical protein
MGLSISNRIAPCLLWLAVLSGCSGDDDAQDPNGGASGTADDGGAAGDGTSGSGGASGRGTGGRAGDDGAGSGGASGGGARDASAADAATDGSTDPDEDASTDDVECPSSEPTAGQACTGQGVCAYGALPGCRTVWECFGGEFVSIYDDACVGPSVDLCPIDPTQPADVCPNQLTHTCVYEDGSICSCLPPSECSGVAPDPESYVFRCSALPRAGCAGGTPVAGSDCPERGLVCGRSCCGEQWTCTANGWDVQDLPCPP